MSNFSLCSFSFKINSSLHLIGLSNTHTHQFPRKIVRKIYEKKNYKTKLKTFEKYILMYKKKQKKIALDNKTSLISKVNVNAI